MYRHTSRSRSPNRAKWLEDSQAQNESKPLERYQTRDFKAGDVYAPHDLSLVQMKKWGRRKSPGSDAFDALNLNPLDMYKVSPLETFGPYGNYFHAAGLYDEQLLTFALHRTSPSCPNI